MERRKIKRYGVNKTRTIAVNFLVIILIGACLLTLPVSSRDGQWTDFMTALFTATSASCVTGLVLVDTFNHWSVFGQILILVMIQIGGLGTIAMRILLATFLRRNITLKARNLLQESINSLHGHKTLVIIAHRLTTIEECDYIFKVENGKIVLLSGQCVT